jgi:hypothetical protein
MRKRIRVPSFETWGIYQKQNRSVARNFACNRTVLPVLRQADILQLILPGKFNPP